ncbi:hypothetical protein [Xanthomonas arboricola]|nr:hypothetical protein [Xanthomonas campestris pv. esculenti]
MERFDDFNQICFFRLGFVGVSGSCAGLGQVLGERYFWVHSSQWPK